MIPPVEDYFAAACTHDSTERNVEQLEARLGKLAPRLFVKDPENISIRITDIDRSAVAASTLYTRAADVKQAITTAPSGTRIRIISIYSQSTIMPLLTTQDLMLALLRQYSVDIEFLQVLFSFGRKPNLAEACSSNISINSGAGLSYRLNYVEEESGRRNPWSFRHTGIHHQQNPDLDLFIILHPYETRCTPFDRRIVGLETANQNNHRALSRLVNDPYLLHSLLFSSYLDNWRWYFEYKGEQFAAENDAAMVAEFDEADPETSFQAVVRLRNMTDTFLHAKACCNSNKQLLQELHASSLSGGLSTYIKSQLSGLQGHIENAEALQERTRNTMELIGYTLTLNNQVEATQINKQLKSLAQETVAGNQQLQKLAEDTVIVTEELRKLTEDTVDDSATVKVITLLSALYLPGSFIATIFGMNFFVFDMDQRKISISHDFWIFIAVLLPLTIITGLLYFCVTYFSRRAKNKRTRARNLARGGVFADDAFTTTIKS